MLERSISSSQPSAVRVLFLQSIPPVTNTPLPTQNPEAFGNEAEESTLISSPAGPTAPRSRRHPDVSVRSVHFHGSRRNDAVSASYQPSGPEILSTSIGIW